MFKNIFGNYSSLAEILCMLVVAGIIGYLFNYLLSRKKWNLRFSRLESKILNLEMKAKEIEDIKDKQGLLFKNNKDMTLKINELDALLGLTSEVNSISKTLNSLNFVSSKDFNKYAHDESLRLEELRQEFVGQVSESNKTVETKFETVNTSLAEQLNSFKEELGESQKNTETVMNTCLEKSSLDFDKLFSEFSANAEDTQVKLEENISETQKELEFLKIKLETQSWSDDIKNLDESFENIKVEVDKVNSVRTDINSLGDKVENNYNVIKTNEDKISNINKEINIIEKNSNKIKVVESSVSKLESSVDNNISVINSYEDSLNNLSDNYSVVSKELNKFEQLDQKVKTHGKAILELSEMENSVVDMKKDLFSFSKSIEKSQSDFLDLEKAQSKINLNLKDMTAIDKEFRKELASVNSLFVKVNQSVDSLEKLIKVHKHEEPDFSQVESSIKKLKNKQDELYLDHKKFGNELSFLKNKVDQKPVSIKTPVKSKKRLKMADKLSIKGIKVSAKDKDDLKLIKGVGPLIEKKMNKLGIYCFEQVSNLSRSDIELITEAIEFFPGRILRDDWKGQAKKLTRKKAS